MRVSLPWAAHGTVGGSPHPSSAVEQHPARFDAKSYLRTPEQRSGRVPVGRPIRTRPLRRKGTQSEETRRKLFPPSRAAPPQDARAHVARGIGRSHRDAHRDRGTPAREQSDQGASSSLQHRPQGRQELSVHSRHHGRCISAPELSSRSPTRDGAVLRAIRERRGDPQHTEPATETLPYSPVRGFVLRESLPALSATPDRALYRALRRPD